MKLIRGYFLLVPAALLSLLLLLYIGYQTNMAAEPRLLELYPAGEPLDAALLHLDRQALDEAYLSQLKKLWGNWVSEQASDPRRMTAGLQIARRAYRQALAQIEARERQLQNR